MSRHSNGPGGQVKTPQDKDPFSSKEKFNKPWVQKATFSRTKDIWWSGGWGEGKGEEQNIRSVWSEMMTFPHLGRALDQYQVSEVSAPLEGQQARLVDSFQENQESCY